MEFSISLTEYLNTELQEFLLADKSEEEICFATWNPAAGKSQYNILLDDIILPKEGDRIRHVTVSALPQYVDRCKEYARERKSGLVMIHTHPHWPGHQGVSLPDLHYEQDVLAREVFGITGLPFVGMTLAGDGTWSGRIYPKPFQITWCSTVKTVGRNLMVDYNPDLVSFQKPNKKQIRTTSVWGEDKQLMLSGLKVCIIGAGSVGAAVGEIMCRMGISKIHLMDYDKIKEHNLDRMNNVTSSDIGKFKIDVVSSNLLNSATSDNFQVTSSKSSVVEEEGFKEALDHDVIFCCVDRPWPRQVLNHLAYSCLIPVIDGGISFRISDKKLIHGMFRAQTVGPERGCLDCLKALNAGQIQQDRDGFFDDPKYIERTEKETGIKTRQNIMPFVFGLSSLETIQFVELVTNLAHKGDLGQQPYDYYSGEILPKLAKCRTDCHYQNNTAKGDKILPFLGMDKSRKREMSEK